MTTRDHDLVELLQAKAAGLVTDSEARDRLRQIRPEWFPTDNGSGAPQFVTGRMARTYTAKATDIGKGWAVTRGGWVAKFASCDEGWNRTQATRLAGHLNGGLMEEPV